MEKFAMSGEDLKPWERPIESAEEFKAGNDAVIAEFRANGGRVGGDYEGSDLMLLTTTGARTGRSHTVALGYQAQGARLIVSSLVETAYPAWYHNLRAKPGVTVEVGTETFSATATVATGEERERLWEWMIQAWPWVADHQQTTKLQIPIVILER
jgi:deazaflavin-dependent oxidoreductase (nitroreductase family)